MANATKAKTWTPPEDQTAQDSFEPIKVRAVVEWANLTKVNDLSEKYQVDLCQLSDKAVAALEAAGINIKFRADKAEKGNYITPTSKNEIYAHDTDGNRIEADLGNGTEVMATIQPFAWNHPKFGSGVSPSLRRLVVTKLVEYVPDTDDEHLEVL